MKLFPVCKVEILQVTVIKWKLYRLFWLISDDFRLKGQKIERRVPWFLADVQKDG